LLREIAAGYAWKMQKYRAISTLAEGGRKLWIIKADTGPREK